MDLIDSLTQKESRQLKERMEEELRETLKNVIQSKLEAETLCVTQAQQIIEREYLIKYLTFLCWELMEVVNSSSKCS